MNAKLARELQSAIHSELFDVTEQGLFFPRQGVFARGDYFGRVNGGHWEHEGPNLVVDEGFAHMLSVAFGGKAKSAGHYLALFSGTASPAANWTAASFTAAANELISQSEGYTAATRPAWVPPTTVTGRSIDNMASVASVTFATATEVVVTGAALLTSAVRGGTTGVLVSASKYSAERKFQNGDTYEIGYRLTMTA